MLAMLGISPGLVSAASPVLEANAVDVTVRGTVTDSNGEPIPGVTVSVPGTTIGTATDLEGRYSLTVPEGSSLAFSFIGFQTQTVSVGDRSVIDITLAEDMASLDEVVVVGYGVQKRANVIGSVSTVNADEIMSQPVSGVSNMLAGRLPGGTWLWCGSGRRTLVAWRIPRLTSVPALTPPVSSEAKGTQSSGYAAAHLRAVPSGA